MAESKTSTLVLYHANCYDGFGSAWAAWKRLGKGAEYRPVKYGESLSVPGWVERLYVLDFCYTKEMLALVASYGTQVTVLDHHKTAFPMLGQEESDWAMSSPEDNPGFELDVSRSGAMMAWNHFHPRLLPPDLIRYVQDRDLWKFELYGSKEFQAALRSYPMDFYIWNELAARPAVDLIDEGAHIERYCRRQVDIMVEQSSAIEIGGFSVPAVNASMLFSEAAHRLLDLFPGRFAVAYYHIRLEDEPAVMFSLRSRGDFDVSEVAKFYGGGGHRNAAGFQLKLSDPRCFELLRTLT